MADENFMQISWVLNRHSDVTGELQKVWACCLRSLMLMTLLRVLGPGIKKKDSFDAFHKCLFVIWSQAAVVFHSTHALLQECSSYSTRKETSCWFCLLFGLTGWVSFFEGTHTWEWLINTSLKCPDNVKQWQMPASGCPFIDKFPVTIDWPVLPKWFPFICNCRQEAVVLKWAIERHVHLQSWGAKTHEKKDTHARTENIHAHVRLHPQSAHVKRRQTHIRAQQ